MLTAETVIKQLALSPLEGEGGYFRRTYESKEMVFFEGQGKRRCGSAILFLITSENFSALHRLSHNDEIFHFYAGSSCEMIQIDSIGNLQTYRFGANLTEGDYPQIVVERGMWQGLRILSEGQWALMGTSVTPGFEFEDFEIGIREHLLAAFPQHHKEIIRYTRIS